MRPLRILRTASAAFVVSASELSPIPDREFRTRDVKSYVIIDNKFEALRPHHSKRKGKEVVGTHKFMTGRRRAETRLLRAEAEGPSGFDN